MKRFALLLGLAALAFAGTYAATRLWNAPPAPPPWFPASPPHSPGR